MKITSLIKVRLFPALLHDEKLYLMEIDKEFYDENQTIKQKRINETERQIFDRPNTDTTYAVKGNQRITEIIR